MAYILLKRLTTTMFGRANMPLLSSHVKYVFPFSDPLFLPHAESSSIPNHSPEANSTV